MTVMIQDDDDTNDVATSLLHIMSWPLGEISQNLISITYIKSAKHHKYVFMSGKHIKTNMVHHHNKVLTCQDRRDDQLKMMCFLMTEEADVGSTFSIALWA